MSEGESVRLYQKSHRDLICLSKLVHASPGAHSPWIWSEIPSLVKYLGNIHGQYYLYPNNRDHTNVGPLTFRTKFNEHHESWLPLSLSGYHWFIHPINLYSNACITVDPPSQKVIPYFLLLIYVNLCRYCCRQERNTISGLGGDKYYPIVVLVYLSNW